MPCVAPRSTPPGRLHMVSLSRCRYAHFPHFLDFDILRPAGRDRVELKLAIGASRWEATQETLQRAVRVALTPILNQMNVVGIVSIPGMMTGQILSGADPSQVRPHRRRPALPACSLSQVLMVPVHRLEAAGPRKPVRRQAVHRRRPRCLRPGEQPSGRPPG